MINLLFLLLGFIPLIYGADLLVDSASSLAKKLNIPNIVIGLTIIAFGTSAPELVVNTFASAAGNSEIVLGNIIGSNIFNILGILGISAIIYPLTVKTNTTWIEIPLCLLSAAIVFIAANDIIIDKSSNSLITRTDGILLLGFFLIFLSYNFQLMKSGNLDEEIAVKEYSIVKSVLLILTGIILPSFLWKEARKIFLSVKRRYSKRLLTLSLSGNKSKSFILLYLSSSAE